MNEKKKKNKSLKISEIHFHCLRFFIDDRKQCLIEKFAFLRDNKLNCVYFVVFLYGLGGIAVKWWGILSWKWISGGINDWVMICMGRFSGFDEGSKFDRLFDLFFKSINLGTFCQKKTQEKISSTFFFCFEHSTRKVIEYSNFQHKFPEIKCNIAYAWYPLSLKLNFSNTCWIY